MKPKFTEIQKFTQWWLWLIILIHSSFVVWQLISAGSSSLVSILFGDILIAVLFFTLKLKTEVNEEGVKMAFFPFIKKEINWEEIKSLRVLDYGFVGGWGIRFWTKYGTVYNVNGRKGLAIELKSGKKLAIGTQKEEELESVLKELGKIGE
ncbi:MAG: hypothetical protein P8Q14_09045 [Vicingaceae bacterium]|nr:hypothetical protein [Vicingaceae bacterium]